MYCDQMRKKTIKSIPFAVLALACINVLALVNTRPDSFRSWNLIASASFGVTAVGMWVGNFVMSESSRLPLKGSSARSYALSLIFTVWELFLIFRLCQLWPNADLLQALTFTITALCVSLVAIWGNLVAKIAMVERRSMR